MTDPMLDRAVAALDLDEIAGARWYAGQGERPTAVTLVDALDVPGSDGGRLVVIDATHADGHVERYLLPGRVGPAGRLEEAEPGDALWPSLAQAISGGGRLGGDVGAFVATAGSVAVEPWGAARRLTEDQSNTSIVLDERVVVKCYRRLRSGIHPEPELLSGLSEVGSTCAPAFGGSLVRRAQDGEQTVACVYSFVPGEPLGWEAAIVALRDLLSGGDRAGLDVLAASIGALGTTTATLHVDLASAFGIETAGEDDAQTALAAARSQLEEAVAVATPNLAAALKPRRARAARALEGLRHLRGAPVTRVHGDLHIAQFVGSADRRVVVDFEGEPGRPLEERRRPGSPLRDLACLLLSFDHVAAAAARRLGFGPTVDAAFAWSAQARAHAEAAYREGVAGSGLVFDEALLRAFEVEKECHEVIYAATVLQEWAYAPALAIARLLDGPGLA